MSWMACDWTQCKLASYCSRTSGSRNQSHTHALPRQSHLLAPSAKLSHAWWEGIAMGAISMHCCLIISLSFWHSKQKSGKADWKARICFWAPHWHSLSEWKYQMWRLQTIKKDQRWLWTYDQEGWIAHWWYHWWMVQKDDTNKCRRHVTYNMAKSVQIIQVTSANMTSYTNILKLVRMLLWMYLFHCHCHQSCLFVSRIGWVFWHSLIGPRGLSFDSSLQWAFYHFATMVGLGLFLCPRRFFYTFIIAKSMVSIFNNTIDVKVSTHKCIFWGVLWTPFGNIIWWFLIIKYIHNFSKYWGYIKGVQHDTLSPFFDLFLSLYWSYH